MSYRLTIPGWQPAKLNEFVGKHWAVGARLKKRDREVVLATLVAQMGTFSLTTVNGKPKKVSLEIVLGPKQKRPPDKDSWWKSLLDALVYCGLLVDDGPKWCEQGTVTYTRGPDKSTTIILEDIE